MTLDADEEQFRRYLLGEMPEEERAALEERYFADEDTFARLLAEEDTLVAAYLHEELPAAERARFEASFLGTADGRRRLGVARELGGRVARPPVSGPAPVRRPLPLWMAAVAAAAVLAAVAFTWQMRHMVPGHATSPRNAANPLGPLATPAAGPPSADVGTAEARPAGPSNVLTVVLAAGLARGAGASTTFAIPPGTPAIRLRLRTSAEDDVRYRVSIQTPEGIQRAASAAATLRQVNGGRAVEVDVPAAALSPGTYIAVLIGITREGHEETVAEYAFRVTRPSASPLP